MRLASLGMVALALLLSLALQSQFAFQAEFISQVTTLDLEYPIRSVQFSSDGRLFIAATAFVVKIWDTESWEEVKLRTVEYPDYLISTVRFTPDGEQFAIAYNGSSSGIKLIDVSSGQQADTPSLLREQEDFVDVLAFHPTGRFFVYGGDRGFLRSWDYVERPREAVSMVQVDPERVRTAIFSSEGTWLATAGNESVKMWAYNREVGKTLGPPKWIVPRGGTQIVFDEEDERLIVKYLDNSIGWIDVDQGVPLPYITPQALEHEQLNHLHYWLPRRALLTAGIDGIVSLWDRGEKIAEQTMLGAREDHLDLRASTISPDGALMAAGYENGEITISRLSSNGF